MNTKHTPGPWVVDDLGDEHFLRTNHRWGIGAESSPAYRVAKVEGMGGESEATARLIAAAPELLEACKTLLMLSLPRDVSGERMVREARRAVEKAEGFLPGSSTPEAGS